MHWIRLIRWPNLLIMGLTMLIVRATVSDPLAQRLEQAGLLAGWSLAVLIGAALVIAAAGYVVNDIIDRHIDAQNRPDRVVVGSRLSVGAAWRAYGLLNGAALVLVLLLVREIGLEPWLVLYPFAGFVLFAYARWLKCTPLVGNVSVALLAALIPGLMLAADWAVLGAPGPLADSARSLVWAYVEFAFLSSLFRELAKDLEDVEGDQACGCGTLAVSRPSLAVKAAHGAALLLLVGVVVFMAVRNDGLISWIAAAGLVGLPLSAAVVAVERGRRGADSALHYRRASLLAKMTMLGGLLLLPLLAAA